VTHKKVTGMPIMPFMFLLSDWGRWKGIFMRKNKKPATKQFFQYFFFEWMT
jgi:hypothetical protein